MAHRWATEHFGLKKWYLHFFFGEITCFRPEKAFQSTSRLIWPENLGRVLEQHFENGAMENFQNENGPRLEKGWEPLK